MERPDLNKPVFKMFPEAAARVSNNRCATCGKEILEEDFKDALSIKEYRISGMCQECQDSVFE